MKSVYLQGIVSVYEESHVCNSVRSTRAVRDNMFTVWHTQVGYTILAPHEGYMYGFKL